MCDQINEAHDPIIVASDENALRWFCNICKHQGIIRMNGHRPELRQYAEVFKRDILQPTDNLFWKYHQQYLRQ